MITVIVLLTLLGGAFAWAYKQGKGTATAAGYKSDLVKSEAINRMNKHHDEQTDSILHELNGPPSVLRGKRDSDR
jgi:high-affinity K+ transport system ATPase subunit B